MARTHSPRHGSMQFWPRVRARRAYARVRSWSSANAAPKDPVLGFIGYKAGMTHIMAIDARKNSITKGEEIFVPVTVIECPPVKIAGVRLYRNAYGGKQAAKDLLFKLDKDLSRKLILPKKHHDLSELNDLNPADYSDVRILAYSQPRLSGVAKKKPELFELALSGTVEEKLKYIEENHDKELHVNSIFKEAEFCDIHAVTRGKGFQGPVKRFGIALKPHKSEKGVRRVGTLGAWRGQGHTLYRVAHAGQMGYHTRTEYNKKILKISNKPEEVNPKGAFPHYGNLKSTFVLIRGSVAGAQKRAIIFTKQMRTQRTTEAAPTIIYISQESKQ